MPLRNAHAIVLRTYRVGESDKIAVLFTREHGKIRGIARAARRPRSRYGSALEVGTEIEVVYFEKPSQELVSLDRCDIVRSSFARLGDPILATTLGYVTDLADAFAPERDSNPRLYRLLRATIDALSTPELAETRARYFEAWLLRLSGFFPVRGTCPTCGRPLAAEGARYVSSEHHVSCRRCLDHGLVMSPATVTFLEQVWKKPPAEVPRPDAPMVLKELGDVCHRIMQEQLDRDLKSLRVFEGLLRESVP